MKEQLCFSKKYEKLKDTVFTTVRWLDSKYELGKTYPVYLVANDMFHRKYDKGEARLIRAQVIKISDLTEEFCRKDAETDREGFLKLMEGWYKRKPDWKGKASEVQMLTFQWVSE